MDIQISNHGSIMILRSMTPRGREWLSEHINKDAMTYAGGIVAEPRFVPDIIEGAIEDGLIVTGVSI